MGLLGWLKKKDKGPDARLGAWRTDWMRALEDGGGPERVRALAGSLDALGLAGDDVEIEREMLEGLEQIAALRAAIAAGGLPVVTTGHKVVAQDACHFSAPVSMPDDPAQPGGRLILTNVRAIFVGSGRSTSIPWHTVARTSWSERDIVLVRPERETIDRFRCNSYGVALCGELIARQLSAAHRRGTGRV
jgi:hypothetical protein